MELVFTRSQLDASSDKLDASLICSGAICQDVDRSIVDFSIHSVVGIEEEEGNVKMETHLLESFGVTGNSYEFFRD